MSGAMKAIVFILTIFFLVLLFDGWLVYNEGPEASISALIIKFSYEMPFAVYLVGLINGIISGHLFWRMKSNAMTVKIDTKDLLK